MSIDLSSLRLAGSIPPTTKLAKMGDHNTNGIPDLMVKFSRSALDPLLTPGVNSLELTGSLVTGESFAGTDQVRVIDNGGQAASVAPNPLLQHREAGPREGNDVRSSGALGADVDADAESARG